MIYIEHKQTKWMGEEQYHTVKPGETLVSLSQEYGIRMKKLAALNRLKPTSQLQAGQQVRLRK
jgi:membrane-bound lytic murein transglycosylase D